MSLPERIGREIERRLRRLIRVRGERLAVRLAVDEPVVPDSSAR